MQIKGYKITKIDLSLHSLQRLGWCVLINCVSSELWAIIYRLN